MLGGAVHHFLENLGFGEQAVEFGTHVAADCMEVFVLLFVVMTGVYFLQSYINLEGLKQRLARLKNFWGYLLAAVLGMLSPFCSCSIVPVLLGLLSMGVPMSVCLCMMTASSLLNLTALTSLYTLMGPSFFGTYFVTALVIVAVSSVIFSRLSFVDATKEYHLGHHHHHESKPTTAKRLLYAVQNAWGVFRSSWAYIVAGVVLSAAIIAFAPMEKLVQVINSHSILSATMAALIGLPIHSDVFSILPVLRLLYQVCPSVAVAFSISTMVISIPGMVLLSRVLKPKVILQYTGTLAALTLAASYLLLI